MTANALLDIIVACVDEEGMFNYLEQTTQEIPIYLSPNMSAGDLSNYICDLTGSYAYISSYIASINHIINVFNEINDTYTSQARESLKKPYGGKLTQAEKEDKVKTITVEDLNICGYRIKKTTIHDLNIHKARVESLLEYYKSILSTIEKSISVGITVLSFQKQELKNLGVA